MAAEEWQRISRRCVHLSANGSISDELDGREQRHLEGGGATAFPRSILHPVIDRQAWQGFMRGKLDTAVFEAFREVEIAVRKAAGFAQHEHGVPTIRRAFHNETGPLTDVTVEDAEREATVALFVGARARSRRRN